MAWWRRESLEQLAVMDSNVQATGTAATACELFLRLAYEDGYRSGPLVSLADYERRRADRLADELISPAWLEKQDAMMAERFGEDGWQQVRELMDRLALERDGAR